MILVGTSGWHYDHWHGPFYPDDVQDELSYYVGLFNTVEINNSFYQLLEAETLKKWRDTVPEGFRFAVKASRYITHMKKLKDTDDALQNFLDRIDHLGDKLGPILFQLPGNWYFNAERLASFLNLLPDHYRYAFEFRDPDWHTKHAYELLADHGAALCFFEFAGDQSPRQITTDYVYIRLHGPENTPYEGEYGKQALSGWAGAISAWGRQGIDVYCYFDNDQAGYAPLDAQRLQAMVVPEGE